MPASAQASTLSPDLYHREGHDTNCRKDLARPPGDREALTGAEIQQQNLGLQRDDPVHQIAGATSSDQLQLTLRRQVRDQPLPVQADIADEIYPRSYGPKLTHIREAGFVVLKSPNHFCHMPLPQEAQRLLRIPTRSDWNWGTAVVRRPRNLSRRPRESSAG
jgi:hypothetical protein